MNSPKVKLALEILKQIQVYYPVGLPISTQSYPGYEIVLTKVESLINLYTNKNSYGFWGNVVNDLQEAFSEYSVYDLAGVQKPSLNARIVTFTSFENSVSRTTTLNISFSILFNYFTVYLNENMNYYSANEFDGVTQLLRSFEPGYVNFYRPSISESEGKFFEKVQQIVGKFYPEYAYLDYEFVKRKTIHGAIPFGIQVEDVLEPYKFPMFDFIFGVQ